MDRSKITEQMIDDLGFGEYWGDSGESGTRHLMDSTNKNCCFMRIHEIDEMKEGNAYNEPATPVHFTTDDWINIDYLDELLEYSKQYTNAYEILYINAVKHGYLKTTL